MADVCGLIMHINSCIYLQPANHAVEQGEMHFRFRCYRNPVLGASSDWSTE